MHCSISDGLLCRQGLACGRIVCTFVAEAGFDKASENEGAAPARASSLRGLAAPGPGQWHQCTGRPLTWPGPPLPGLRPGRGRSLAPWGSGGAVKPCAETLLQLLMMHAGPWLQLHGVKPGEKVGILPAHEGRLRVVVEQHNQRMLGLPHQVYHDHEAMALDRKPADEQQCRVTVAMNRITMRIGSATKAVAKRMLLEDLTGRMYTEVIHTGYLFTALGMVMMEAGHCRSASQHARCL